MVDLIVILIFVYNVAQFENLFKEKKYLLKKLQILTFLDETIFNQNYYSIFKCTLNKKVIDILNMYVECQGNTSFDVFYYYYIFEILSV